LYGTQIDKASAFSLFLKNGELLCCLFVTAFLPLLSSPFSFLSFQVIYAEDYKIKIAKK
jgi:hypothetical protein